MNYYHIPPSDLGHNAHVPLIVLGDSGEVFLEMALEMVHTIREHNKRNEATVFICPVGPIGHYPIFVRLVNEERLSLARCWFINMDEYLTDDDLWIDEHDPLSFRGFMNREVYGKIEPDLLMPEEQRIFPDPQNLDLIPNLIGKLGGVDIAFGGIGITGHLAFNEPEEGCTVKDFAALKTRIVNIRPETRATNCTSDMGGCLENFPKRAVTIGMNEILSASKVRLGVFRDWHRAVVRRAAYGKVTAEFPATLVQNHPDARIYVNNVAAQVAY